MSQFSSLQLLSHVRLFATPCIAARQASLSITNSWSSLRLSVHRVSHATQPSHPQSSPSPPAPNPSSIRVFSNESTLHMRWPKYWSLSFSISLSNEYSGLISFTIDWFDLLTVLGTEEYSPGPQFKSINSLVLSLLYGPAVTFIHDYWKNHSFDCTDLCWPSDVSAF